MTLIATCRCGAQFAAQPELAGQQVACPACGQALAVPAAPGAPAEARPQVVACGCGSQFQAEAHLAGQQVACPTCGRPINIPRTPPPGSQSAASMHNVDGFWDNVAAPQSQVVGRLADGVPLIVSGEDVRLTATEAMTYAVKRKRAGVSRKSIVVELINRGVTPKQARDTVEVLYEDTKRGASFFSNPGIGRFFFGVGMMAVGVGGFFALVLMGVGLFLVHVFPLVFVMIGGLVALWGTLEFFGVL